MKKNKILKIVIFCSFLLILAGCKKQIIDTEINFQLSNNIETENPFAKEDTNTEIMGALSHGLAIKDFDEDGNVKPIQFNGEEIKIEYSVVASGGAKNVGFLLFVDGIAQHYTIDSDDEYTYLKSITLKEDEVKEYVEFNFTPVTGVNGDLLPLTILSVYNPDFKPDMIDTTNYGLYHHTLASTNKIKFEQDAQINSNYDNYLQDIVQSNEYLTDEFMKTKLSTGLINITNEMLDNNVYSLIYYDDKEILSGNLEYYNQMIDVEYVLCGVDGAEYSTTFYVDHQAISQSFHTVLEKGKLSIINMKIDVEKLKDATTFYAISVPINSEDYINANVMTLKTPSLLLYKGETKNEN